MKIFMRITVLIFAIAATFGFFHNNLQAEMANTQWPSFRFDVKNTGRSKYAGIDTPKYRWIFPAKSFVEASPIVGPDGTVYGGSEDHNFYAINPNGTQKWVFPTDGLIRSTAAFGMDGTIYFGSYDYNLYALTEDGKLKWSYTTASTIGSSPKVGDDGTIYVGCIDGNLYAINSDGTLKWKYRTDERITFSSPAIDDDGTVYVGSYDDNLYAINPDGTLKWFFSSMGPIRTSPSIGQDGTIYVGSRDGILYALAPEDGSLVWSFDTGSDIRSSTALAADGTIYFGTWDNTFYALNPDGTEQWSVVMDSPIESSPAVDANGIIYFAAMEGKYYALYPDGSLKWGYGGGMFHSSPAIGGDGTIYGSVDYSFVAIGEPYPEIDLSINKQLYYNNDELIVRLTISNDATVSWPIEIKVWLTSPRGKNYKILKVDSMNLAPGEVINQDVFNYLFDGSEPRGRYTVGARLLLPKTGDYYDEKIKHFVKDML